MYTPDKYIMVKVTIKETNEVLYKIFGTWYGGFIDGDSWRMNSGIVRIKEYEKYYDVIGRSGSIYRCIKKSEGTSMYSGSVLGNYIEQLKDRADIKIVDIKEFIGEWVSCLE